MKLLQTALLQGQMSDVIVPGLLPRLACPAHIALDPHSFKVLLCDAFYHLWQCQAAAAAVVKGGSVVCNWVQHRRTMFARAPSV